ncbi:hypothetical protein SDC9_53700 [bioreactor metagenome]|uniref:Nitrogen fixation protein NifH n=1 Tax=bioreactor metagenome TaxID=1076179 RepID=A0A644WZN3_9ZZZZ
MGDWKAALKADPTDWLLEDGNPSVRYFALKDLLDRPEKEEETRRAKRAVMDTGMVPEILALQREPDYIEANPRFYTNKYEGLAWQLIVLAELGAERSEQIAGQCEYILTHSQEAEGGGFSQHAGVKTRGGLRSEVIPCLTGNMVWSLIRFGYLEDPRVQKGIGWLSRFLKLNDGVEEDPQEAPYNRYEMCWGKHTCHMGVVKAMKALGEIPEEKRSEETAETLRKASEFLLLHHVHKRSHNLNRASKPGWLKFGFPLMYQTDALEILDILTGLGITDERMEEAVGAVLEKQDDMGRWRAENTYNSDRLLIPFEKKGDQSKWITLRAMRVLKRFEGGRKTPSERECP